jgi:hypothetical protein
VGEVACFYADGLHRLQASFDACNFKAFFNLFSNVQFFFVVFRLAGERGEAGASARARGLTLRIGTRLAPRPERRNVSRTGPRALLLLADHATDADGHLPFPFFCDVKRER